MKLSVAGGVVLWVAETIAAIKGAEHMHTYVITNIASGRELGTVEANSRLEALEGLYADTYIADEDKYPNRLSVTELKHRHCPVYCNDSAKCDREEDGVYCNACGHTVGPCLQQATQDYAMSDDNYMCDLCLMAAYE